MQFFINFFCCWWCEVFVLLEFMYLFFMVWGVCFPWFYAVPFLMMWGICFSWICAFFLLWSVILNMCSLFFFIVWCVCFSWICAVFLWCEVLVFHEFVQFYFFMGWGVCSCICAVFLWCEVFVFLEFAIFFGGGRKAHSSIPGLWIP